MSAIATFPKHISPGWLERGLVLQENSEVDCNESGLEQGTLSFLCLHKHYKRFKPKRGTPLVDLPWADDDTRAALRQMDFLGAQTTRLNRDAGGPGVGILEVLCQGAIFAGNSKDIKGVITPASTDDPITLPFTPSSSTIDTITPIITQEDAITVGDISTPSWNITATINYHSIDLHFEYMARDYAQRPRFLRSSYDVDPKTGFLIIDDDGTLQELLIDSVAIKQNGSITLVNPTVAVVDIVGHPEKHWRDNLVNAGTGSRFEQTPAGPFWHVLETTTIKLVPKEDWQASTTVG